MNSQFAIKQSRLAARQIVASLKDDVSDKQFVAAAYETVLSRRPSPAEQALCLEFLERQRTVYSQQTVATSPKAAANSVPAAKDPLLRSRESLVRTLFSHHDFITIH